MPAVTLDALTRDLAGRLESAGIEAAEARLDAELIARAALGWDRATWIARLRDPAPPALPAAVEPLVARRAAREPMAYLLGRCEFWGHEFEVAPAVLIPRPETELIVEEVLRRLTSESEATVVDVGTGSGCLAVAIAVARPRVKVIATDISAAALAVAQRNARRLGVADRIAFRHAALLDDVAGADMVVSNPPYVPERDRARLPPEVREHEPAEALFAGPDGLDVIRSLVPAAAERLVPGGWLVFEFGFGQDAAVRSLLESDGAWAEADILADLQGIPRTAAARRGA